MLMTFSCILFEIDSVDFQNQLTSGQVYLPCIQGGNFRFYAGVTFSCNLEKSILVQTDLCKAPQPSE